MRRRDLLLPVAVLSLVGCYARPATSPFQPDPTAAEALPALDALPMGIAPVIDAFTEATRASTVPLSSEATFDVEVDEGGVVARVSLTSGSAAHWAAVGRDVLEALRDRRLALRDRDPPFVLHVHVVSERPPYSRQGHQLAPRVVHATVVSWERLPR